MDMEHRKANWLGRVFTAADGKLTMAEVRRIVSICQDAFNEGHKAGEASTLNQVSPYLKGETPNDR